MKDDAGLARQLRWADALRPSPARRMMRRLAIVLALVAVPAGAVSPELRAAWATLAADRPVDALPLAQAAIDAHPQDGRARLLAARVHLALGDGAAAEAALDRAAAADIPPALTNHLRAHALLLEGEPARALDRAGAIIAPRFRGYALRMRGRALMAAGDMAGAGAAFDAARRADPLDAAAWIDTATFARATGNIAAGLAAADRAVALAPMRVAALVARGEAARTQYGLRAALPWFARALAVDPRSVPALLARAAVEGELGQVRAMLATTRAVLRIDPGNGDAFYLQAVLAGRARAWPLARTLLDKAGADVAERPAAMLLAGVIAVESGNPEQAIATLRRLVAMQPDHLPARRAFAIAQWRAGDPAGVVETLAPVADAPDADAYVLTLTGRALERIGARDRAAAYLDRAAQPVAPVPGIVPDLAALRRAATRGGADARVALVRGLLAAGQGTAALAEATALRDAFPGVPATHLLVGDAATALDRPAVAAAAYRAAADLAFTEPVALRLIAALRRAGDGPAAQRALALYLDQNPRSVPARLLRADLLLSGARWAEAADVLEAVRRRIGPRDAAVASNLAWAYGELGRREPALAFAAQAARLAPAAPAVATTRGWLLHASGADRPRGLALLRQAVAQSPRDPTPRWRLALAYAADGRRADARRTALAVLALPGFAQVAAARRLAGLT